MKDNLWMPEWLRDPNIWVKEITTYPEIEALHELQEMLRGQ